MENKEPPKKCFCARCFMAVDEEDKVYIEGQNFHRICSMCCVCRSIPKSIKMFYGHVFCAECFKNHVLGRFKGEPRVQSNSWWTQWVPGMKPRDQGSDKDDSKSENSSEQTKKCFCARCLQPVEDNVKVDIGEQHFHPMCAKCYFCQCVPTTNLKIYYGQVFCENCFHRHVLNRQRDNPTEFFKACFEQWRNPQFAENMKEFMSSKDGTPLVFCRCSGGNDWGAPSDPKKSVSPPLSISGDESIDTWDLSIENRTEFSSTETIVQSAAEKIEKLTQYLHKFQDCKKWKNFVEADKSIASWVDLQERCGVPRGKIDCPKCLWQCGPIYVSRDVLSVDICDAIEYKF